VSVVGVVAEAVTGERCVALVPKAVISFAVLRRQEVRRRGHRRTQGAVTPDALVIIRSIQKERTWP
jgi:hypothetical protein